MQTVLLGHSCGHSSKYCLYGFCVIIAELSNCPGDLQIFKYLLFGSYRESLLIAAINSPARSHFSSLRLPPSGMETFSAAPELLETRGLAMAVGVSSLLEKTSPALASVRKRLLEKGKCFTEKTLQVECQIGEQAQRFLTSM